MTDSKGGEMKLSLEEWTRDKTWADRYVPAIREVIDKVASKIVNIQVATAQEDAENATDYIITLETGTIACRIRRPNCNFRDLTLRAWRSSGAKTELEKIKEGHGKYYLYAWAKDADTFADWIFVDLDKFRESKLPFRNRTLIKNPDGTTGFINFKIPELLYWNCIIKRGLDVED